MDYFMAMIQEMKSFLKDHGVRKIITACPNCHKIFQSYGEPIIALTVYESLSKVGLPECDGLYENMGVSVHDPCVMRYDSSIHDTVRKLAAEKGFTILDMPHSRCKTLCCGEGGNVEAVSPRLAGVWTKRRSNEAGGRAMLTYCAGCANKLSGASKTFHILDAVLNPRGVVSGNVNVSRAPWTYLNRLRVKRLLKKQNPDDVTRERRFNADSANKKKGWLKILFVAALAVLIGVFHATGATRYLDQAALRTWVESLGVFAPLIYILIYTVAPVFLLPGLPITIAGGILFGPVWGVVYTIIGATAGACASFLIARYIARDWIKSKLRSPRWKMLDEGVARHGWKIVAFTRLIPVFPFNLLNYAFGLTAIPFLHYAIASFICMLPACIAFIVFSSSLLELIAGKVSAEFIAGLVLMGVVMLIPLVYRKIQHMNKKGESNDVNE
jgi:uncharacterized membrane protein YdjX (TVP38/TMEM64 family)